jgi:hypothetical protein
MTDVAPVHRELVTRVLNSEAQAPASCAGPRSTTPISTTPFAP